MPRPFPFARIFVLTAGLTLAASVSGKDAAKPHPPAQPKPPEPVLDAPKHGPINLRDCIEIALDNNLGLGIKRIGTASAQEDVQIAWSAYDPAFFVNAGRSEAAGIFGARDVYLNNARAGFNMRTLSGANVQLSGGVAESYDFIAQATPKPSTKPTPTPKPNEKVKAATPVPLKFDRKSVYDSDVGITVRQPLLKGAGFHVNRIPIDLGLIAVNQANLDLRRSVLDLLQAVENAYWQIAYARRDLEVREKTLENSRKLITETKARVKVGLASPVDGLQSETALASRQEAVIISRKAIADRTDELLLLLSKLGVAKYSIEVPERFPSVSPAPEPDDERAIEIIRQLPEYQVQVEAIKAGRLYVDKARNDYLPAVDLTAGGGYVGRGSSYNNSFNNALHRNNQDWTALLEVSLPLGFRAERAALSKSRYSLEVANMTIQQVEQQLHASLRETIRAVTAGRARVTATQAAVKLSEQEFEQFFAKYKEGLTTFRDARLAQDDLEEARLSALAAQLDAVLADVRLARLDGSLLLRNKLNWSK